MAHFKARSQILHKRRSRQQQQGLQRLPKFRHNAVCSWLRCFQSSIVGWMWKQERFGSGRSSSKRPDRRVHPTRRPCLQRMDRNARWVCKRANAGDRASSQKINIIGSQEGSRKRRRHKDKQTGKKCRVSINSNNSTTRNYQLSRVDRCIHVNAMMNTTNTSSSRQTIKI